MTKKYVLVSRASIHSYKSLGGRTFPQAKIVISLDNFLHPSSNNLAEPLCMSTFVLENKVVSSFPYIVNYNNKYRLQFSPFFFPILMLQLIHMSRRWEKKN